MRQLHLSASKSWDSSHLMVIFSITVLVAKLSLRGWDGGRERLYVRKINLDMISVENCGELMRKTKKHWATLGPGWCLSSWMCTVTKLHCFIFFLAVLVEVWKWQVIQMIQHWGLAERCKDVKLAWGSEILSW